MPSTSSWPTVPVPLKREVIEAGTTGASGAVKRTTRPASASATQRRPSGPVMIARGRERFGIPYSVMKPSGVERPIRSPSASVNHMASSGPDAMLNGVAPGVMPLWNSLRAPLGVIRPIRSPSSSVNHRLPSMPTAMSSGPLTLETENAVTAPDGVILTIRSPRGSVNQIPPGPRVIPSCSPPGVSPEVKTVHSPAVVSRATAPARNRVTQSAPSAPAAIPRGAAAATGTGNVVTAPARVTRPTALPSRSVNHIAPSGPRVMESGVPGTGTTLSNFPFAEMRATKLPTASEVIQTSRLGPTARSRAALAGRPATSESRSLLA